MRWSEQKLAEYLERSRDRMTKQSQEFDRQKADRALELYEKGIERAVIAERLGVSPAHIGGMLQRARQRRNAVKRASPRT